MPTKEDILRILKDESSFLKERYGICKIGLFGSYSRGEQDAESDIDLLVKFEKPIGFFKYVAVEEYLKEKLGAKVEMVMDDALKPVIRPYVMKEVVYV